MANKPIFSVDIDDAKFKAFTGLVDKYYDQLTKMPGQWQKVNQAMAPDATVAALGAQTQILTKILEGEKSVAVEAERTERSWRGISHYTKDAASNIASTALTLAKWTGIATALGAIVGAISFDRMISSVSDTRRSAGGFGIGYGQQQAFGLNLGRFIDPGSMLSASRNAIYDITNPAFVALRAAGINPQGGGNAADLSAQLLERLPALFAGTPKGLILPQMRALGLDQFLNPDDAVRYLGADPKERREQLDRFKEDARNLNLQKEVTRGWQDFSTALGRAELGIENTFVKGLAPLVSGPGGGPLGKLTESVERAAATFLSGADKWIGPLGDGIEKFAKYLVSPDFQDDLSSFKKNIGDAASAIGDAAAWIRSITPKTDKAVSTVLGPVASAMADTAARVYGPNNRHFTTADVQDALHRQHFLPPNQRESDFLGLIGQLENAKRDPNYVSPQGDVGLYQINPRFHPEFDASRLKDPTYNTQAALTIVRSILKDSVRRYHGDPDKMILAYHRPGAASGDVPMLPSDQAYVSHAHANPGYQKVVIEIHDATGGNPITAGAQVGLGGAP